MKAENGSLVTNCKNSIILQTTGKKTRTHANVSRAKGFFIALAVACNFSAAAWAEEDKGKTETAPVPPSSGETSKDSSSSKDSVSSILHDISFYGVDLQEAISRHFFSYWRLRQIGTSVTKDGFTEILFRLPRTSRFRPFVSMFVALDNEGRIIRARIQLKRRFITDKVQGAFARDFTKGFVQAAVPLEDLDDVRLIANEIFFRQEITRIKGVEMSKDSKKDDDSKGPSAIFKLGTGKLKVGDIIIMGEGGEMPDLPKKPSDLYRAFMGETKTAKQKLSHNSVLKFSNPKIQNEDTLVVSVSDIEESDDKEPLDYGNMPMHVPVIP